MYIYIYIHQIFAQNNFLEKNDFLFRIKNSLLRYKFDKKINAVDNVTYFQICFENKFKIKAMLHFLLNYLLVFCFWFCLSYYISFSFYIVLLYFTFCKKLFTKLVLHQPFYCFFRLLRSYFTLNFLLLFCVLLSSNLLLLCCVIFYYFFCLFFFSKF